MEGMRARRVYVGEGEGLRWRVEFIGEGECS